MDYYNPHMRQSSSPTPWTASDPRSRIGVGRVRPRPSVSEGYGQDFGSPQPMRRIRPLNAMSESFTPTSQAFQVLDVRRNFTSPASAYDSVDSSYTLRSRISAPDFFQRNHTPARWMSLGRHDLDHISCNWPSPEHPTRSAQLTSAFPQESAVAAAQVQAQQGLFDPYSSSTPISSASHGQHATQINPYLHDQGANGATSYFQSSGFTQPLNLHLYVSQTPHRQDLAPNQRAARDFFIPDSLREELQRKSHATLQILPSRHQS